MVKSIRRSTLRMSGGAKPCRKANGQFKKCSKKRSRKVRKSHRRKSRH